MAPHASVDPETGAHAPCEKKASAVLAVSRFIIVVSIRGGVHVEISAGGQVADHIVAVGLALAQRQLALNAAAKLIIGKARRVLIGVDLADAVAQFVVTIAGYLAQGIGYRDQPAQHIVTKLRDLARLVGLGDLAA